MGFNILYISLRTVARSEGVSYALRKIHKARVFTNEHQRKVVAALNLLATSFLLFAAHFTDMAKKNIDRDNSDEEGKRGPTIMRIITDMKNKGELVELGWNPYNLPIGPYADMFLTYISLVTHNCVPISYNNLKQVPKGHKEHI